MNPFLTIIMRKNKYIYYRGLFEILIACYHAQ